MALGELCPHELVIHGRMLVRNEYRRDQIREQLMEGVVAGCTDRPVESMEISAERKRAKMQHVTR